MRPRSEEGSATAECATVMVAAVAMAIVFYEIAMAPTMRELFKKPFEWVLAGLF